MRLRTMIATVLGASAGAGAMYLLDPEHGRVRRRELARTAVTRGREEVATATRGVGARASERARFYADRARAGFAETADAPRADAPSR